MRICAQPGSGRNDPAGGRVLSGADFDRLAAAARSAAERDAEGRADREPSLGARLAQIGVLGWIIVVPILIGIFAGRWLDGIRYRDCSTRLRS